jgi:hypothetical protein
MTISSNAKCVPDFGVCWSTLAYRRADDARKLK